VTLVRRDGTKFPSEISSATFCVREGQSRNSMVIRDITARKKAEERERLARETLDLLGRSEGAEETIRAILAAVKTTTGFDAVAIRLRDGNDFPYYVTRGFPEEFVLAERFLCARDRAGEILRDGEGNPVLECLCGDILCGRTNPALPFFTRGGSFWANSTTKLLDMTTELDPPARMRNVCNSYGYESVALIPLRAGAEIIGLLQLNDHRPNQLTPEMVHFFEGLGASIGIALARRRAAIESEKLQAQFLQAQKMESVGRLAGGVAHDFNNLLTVINGYSELLLRKVHVGDPMREGLEEIHRAGGRAAGLTQQLLAYSRRQMLQPRSINLDRVVSEMEPMLARLVGEDVELCVEMHSEGAMIFADPHQLGQVLMNLAVNSRDAMPGGGRLSIHTAVVERSESDAQAHPEAHAGQYVMLSVSDTGEGMNEETRQKVFEPFFTTKGADKGTGLGLSMVHGIVHQSRGHIEIHSEPGCGTTFQIYLPRVEGLAADSGELDATPVSAIGGKETVLVVEDTAEVRKFAASALQPYGYRVIQAENAEEAMLLCERKRERIDLVLTDVVMPQVSGRVLAERLEKLQPGIKVLFMSGYSDDITSHHGVLAEGVKLIEKPFTAEQLASKVREVLGSAEGKGPTILVVDDFAAIRSLIAETLSTAGYAVLEACDGVQARELLREHEVQLVLMDINMPTQGGLGAARQIRGSILRSRSF
jgi:signal transduction histidine kinase/CheY-like chemotaxis protein